MNSTQKNYGIELLRITSMFYVVILHTLGHGGLLKSLEPDNGASYKLAWLLEIFAYCAVDIFALISGYVGFPKSINYNSHIKKITRLWGVVFFYSILSVFICLIICPEKISNAEIINSFFPLTNGLYWYFNAYIVAFFFFPIINYAFDKIPEEAVKIIVIILGFALPFYEIMCNQFKLLKGYSSIWLIILYIIGVSVKKANFTEKTNKYLLIVIILISTIIVWLWKMHGISFKSEYIAIEISKDTLISYLSPLILLAAICYLLLFSQFTINNSTIQKILGICGKSCFAIYLLNDNWLIRNKILKGSFTNLKNDFPLLMIIKVLGFAICFVIISLIIDILRTRIVYFFKTIYSKLIYSKNNNQSF